MAGIGLLRSCAQAKMKTITTIMTLLISIGCVNTNHDYDRTELIPEPDNDTQVQSTKDQKENEPKTKCSCDGLVDWHKDVKVKLFDKPNGQVIDTLTHDIQGEDFLTFTIMDSEAEFFKVKIGRAIEGQQKIGWIKKENYLGTYARNYSDNDTLFLFAKPDLKSKPTDTISKYYTELYIITDCKGKWAKVTMKTNDREFKGWIEPEMQCSNPYTTCN